MGAPRKLFGEKKVQVTISIEQKYLVGIDLEKAKEAAQKAFIKYSKSCQK